ncbi:MAG: hypothetical protein RI554_10380 [Trueperaceae bacterium]|nr:hypothetical protein [Trueperaceae bacterium]
MSGAAAANAPAPHRLAAVGVTLALAAALTVTGVPWRVAPPSDGAPPRPAVGLPGHGDDLAWRATPAPAAPSGAAAGAFALALGGLALRTVRTPLRARRGRTSVRAGRAQRWFARRLLDGG